MPELFTSSDGCGRPDMESPLHYLDVRTKMVVSGATALVVIVLNSMSSLLPLVLVSVVYMLLARRWKVAMVAYLVVAVLWLIAVGFMYLMDLFMPRIGSSDPVTLLIPFLRSLVLVNVLLAMALSSRIQGVLTALKSLRLPYWLYVPAAVMVRFLPSFVEDLRQIGETARIRGYSLNPLRLATAPWLSLRLLVVPIFFRALRTSDELGIAAELKGVSYGGAVSPWRENPLRSADYAVLTGAVLLLAGALIINHQAGGPPVMM